MEYNRCSICRGLLWGEPEYTWDIYCQGHPEQGSIYWYQPLFDLISKEHGKTLLKSEMDDIISVVQKMLNSDPNPERSVATELKSGEQKLENK